jgi:DNA-binding NarL/FixJ family response regulator
VTELRVGLIINNDLVRSGRNMVISSQRDMRVVLEESDAQVAISRAPEYLVDVLVAAHSQHGFTGSGFVEKLSSALSDSGNEASILVLAPFATDQARWEAIQAGAADLVGLEASGAYFLKKVRSITKSDYLADPEFISSFGATQPAVAPNFELESAIGSLTKDQRTQLALSLGGLSDHEIAKKFDVSKLRVRQLVDSLSNVAGVRTRSQLSILLREFKA